MVRETTTAPRAPHIRSGLAALCVSAVGTLLLALAVTSPATAQSSGNDLPDIGSPAGALVTESDEYRLGAQIVRTLRDQKAIMNDPEVTEYLQSLGMRIAAQAPEGNRRFTFFPVNEATINAFALPGGFIGVNYGTVLASQNESELAGVVGHEIAHVTQRHIARTIRAQGQQGIAQTAAILAAILIGAIAGGADAMQGAIAIAQGAAAQQQVNFTRANEYEADRVGIGFTAAAGFDPNATATFFETMSRRTGLAGQYVPEMIQTHPVNANRIAEARARAAQLGRKNVSESATYECIRERLRVLTYPKDGNIVERFKKETPAPKGSLGYQYGLALALMTSGRNQEAAKILYDLVEKHENLTLLYSALAQAQVDAGMQNDGLATYARAIVLFPRNVALSVRYAEALMAAGKAKEAHALLLDVFNNVAPTPEQIQLIALAASAAGDTGDAYYYMSEYHIASGDLPLAVQQLELALAAPNLTSVQRQRFQARLDEIRDYLATVRVRKVNRERDGS
ncbi:MAG: M48 family metallopeptidase [Steroidobacteraceae bacterium]|nr:M48 family metallopeptidase [Steroidobacteraceae bacterium]